MMRKGLIALTAVVLLLTSTFTWAQNLPPVVDAGLDQNILVDERTLLDGSATDPDGDFIVSWQWNIESAPEGSSPYISDLITPDPEFLTDTPGEYVLSLIACDALLCSEPDTVTINVAPILPPVVIINADVTSGTAPLTVNFDGSESYDPQGGELYLRWSFGDGTPTSPEISPTNVYTLPGVYTARLLGVDSIGQITTASIEIRVAESCLFVDPQDRIYFSYLETQTKTISVSNVCSNAITLTNLSLTAESSTDYSITSTPSLPYLLAPGTSASVDVTFTPTTPYSLEQATFVVESDDPNTPSISLLLTTAGNVPPIVDAGQDQGLFVDGEISLAGSATDPDGDFIVSWQWNIESAPEGSSPYISDLFTPDPVFSTDTAGNYVLTLIACDFDLCSEPDTVTIHVTDYEVHEISQEQGRYPTINDRRDCIWIGASGGLYFYDAFTGETKLLDAAATIFSGYEINNNGDVGWHAPWYSTVEDKEVYVYDHSSRTNIQITNNDLEDRFYTITDDGTVYFVTKQVDDTFTLKTYSIETGVTTVADLYQFAQWPEAINANGDVLWQVRDASYKRQLYLYSAATGITNPISPFGASAFDPSMNDRGDVSYRLFATDYHAIMFYDAATGQTKELTRGAPNSVWEPKTSNNGNVVWTGDDTAENIHYYHYLTDTLEQLTFLADNSVTGYWDKDINGVGDSVWIDWTRYGTSGTELNIYLHEEGLIGVINNVTDPEWPQINNNGDAVFEGVNSLGTGQGVYLATRSATVDEVVNTIEELTTEGSLDTATAEELQTSFDEAMEALSAGDETTAEKKIAKFEADIDKAEKKGDLEPEDAKKLEDAIQEVTNSK